MQTGASLVPVLSFGENDLFTTYRPDKASRLAKVQRCAPASLQHIAPEHGRHGACRGGVARLAAGYSAQHSVLGEGSANHGLPDPELAHRVRALTDDWLPCRIPCV